MMMLSRRLCLIVSVMFIWDEYSSLFADAWPQLLAAEERLVRRIRQPSRQGSS
jgi:hypothetical protein